MVKPKAILVIPAFQSFILQDIKLLSERYDLIINQYNWEKKELAPVYFIRQLFHLVSHILTCRFVLVHFGGYWAFWPALLGKVFGKPVFINLHGTDCASIPELNYGSLRIPLLRWFCKMSYNWANLLLPVSQSLVKSSNEFYSQNFPLENGFLHHFPSLQTAHQVIPNGFDIDYWKINPRIAREKNSFLAVLSEEQFILKGGDLIVELARRFPDCNFRIAGMYQPERLNENLGNLEFLGKLSKERILTEYQKSSFYFQLSIFEGFGCSLCEAMLCGCIPIAAAVNEIPNIIQNHGILLQKRDINQLEKIVRKVISSPLGQKERVAISQHISNKYPLGERKEMLFSVLPK
jgi:glycosyltransferase involved in cell wall biosynthesis